MTVRLADRDAPDTGPVDLDDDFALYVETEDEIRVPTRGRKNARNTAGVHVRAGRAIGAGASSAKQRTTRRTSSSCNHSGVISSEDGLDFEAVQAKLARRGK